MTDLADVLIAEWGWKHPLSRVQSLGAQTAGGGFTIPSSGAVEQTLAALSFTLVTDDNAANRIAVFEYLDPDGIPFAQVAAPFTQAASLTTVYTFAVGIQQFGADDAAHIGAGVPALKLDSTLAVAVEIENVQVGDQVSVVRAAWQRWPVRPPLHGAP